MRRRNVTPFPNLPVRCWVIRRTATGYRGETFGPDVAGLRTAVGALHDVLLTLKHHENRRGLPILPDPDTLAHHIASEKAAKARA